MDTPQNITPQNQIPANASPKASPMLLRIIAIIIIFGAYTVLALLFNLPPFPRHVTQPPMTTSPLVSPSGTSDWQTYQDTNHGFGLKYPAPWTLKSYAGTTSSPQLLSLNSPENETLLQQVSGTQSGEGYTSDITITYYPNIAEELSNKSNNLQATSLKDYLDKDTSNIRNIRPMQFAGYEAYKVDALGLGIYTVIYVNKNGEIYEINLGDPEIKSTRVAAQNQILSTFRFTTPTSQINISDWEMASISDGFVQYKFPASLKIDAQSSAKPKYVQFRTDDGQDAIRINYVETGDPHFNNQDLYNNPDSAIMMYAQKYKSTKNPPTEKSSVKSDGTIVVHTVFYIGTTLIDVVLENPNYTEAYNTMIASFSYGGF